jgi:ankyrin repeat protein
LKKLFLIISLLISVNLLAVDKELTIIEQEKLLEWTNKNCNEQHDSFLSLSRDRYFFCSMDSSIDYPNGLQGTVIFGNNSSPWISSLLTCVIILVFFAFLVPIGILSLNIAEEKLQKGKLEDKERRLNFIKSRRSSLIALIIASLIVGSVTLTYIPLKKQLINTVQNGNIEDIKLVLPIVELIVEDDVLLFLAVSNGRIEVVKYLIEDKKYNPNFSISDKDLNSICATPYIPSYRKETPLGLALRNKSLDIANYLKQYIPSEEPIDILIASRALDLDLLEKSIDLTEPSTENILDAFIVSIRAFDYDAMLYLYNLNPSIINMQADRYTSRLKSASLPIEEAVESNNFEAFKFLLSKNAKLVSEIAYGPRERIHRIEYHEVISKVVYLDNIKFFNLLLENGYEIKKDEKWMMKNIFLPTATGIKRGESKKIEKLIIDKGWITKKEMQKIKDDVYYGQI